MLLQILLLTAPLWTLYSAICLLANYLKARMLKVPMIIVPISGTNVPWVLLEPRLWPLIERLPFSLADHFYYMRREWTFHDKHKTHERLGDYFVKVTPGQNMLYISDGDAVSEIFARNKDFTRPVHFYRVLDIFGKSVVTVEGTDWQRHRKVTAAPFNEKSNASVWAETLSQANDMLTQWLQAGNNGVRSLASDVRTLSLNVLAATGFKSPQKFNDVGSYREALGVILENALFMMLVPSRVMSWPIVPRSWARIGQAMHDYKKHMLHALEAEKESILLGKPEAGGLISSLIRASEDAPSRMKAGNPSSNSEHSARATPLTNSEILGNWFVMNVAGHDTTANTLAYGILFLAANRDVQDWVFEEIREILSHERHETWGYDDSFPRLKRCQAIMFETLRLFSTITEIPKGTGAVSQTLNLKDRVMVIPPRTAVLPSLLATHRHPKYWGADSSTWRPSRWISTSSSSPISATRVPDIRARLETEFLIQPVKGSYFPWAEGARFCPGKKFSLVEFVAVLARLFGSCTVRPVLEAGEDLDHAERRLVSLIEDSCQGLLMHIREPEKAALAWERR